MQQIGPDRSRRRRSAVLHGAIALSLLGVLQPSTFAVIVTTSWRTAVSGSWGDFNRWSGGEAPRNDVSHNYNAIIGVTGPAYVISLTGFNTVDNLTISSANASLQQT